MKLELYQYVTLCRDIPEHNFKRGDVAMLIDYVTHPGNGEDGYILEVFRKLSAKIREQVNVPIFLAGGLKPENVTLAVRHVSPFGLDVCSGVHSHGKLDEKKLKQFFQEINV